MTSAIAYDFGPDADYGLTGFDGPITSAGAGPVSAGILVTEGTPLTSVRLYDVSNGPEGVQGIGRLYYAGGIPAVPVPGSLLLGGLGAGLVGWIRRRRLA